MNKVAYLGITPLLVGLIFGGCSSHDVKPEAGVKSSIIADYLSENGANVKGSALPCGNGKCSESIDPENTKTGYEKERDRMLAKIVKTSPTPMRVPDTVLRVLLLPYEDDSGALTTQNYKFVKADDGKWILGEYLNKEGSAVRMLTPLTKKTLAEEVQGSEIKSQKQSKEEKAPDVANPMMTNNTSSSNAWAGE
ncbi:MAG: TraV family lipoprotein [Sulfurimonas sp.]|jgi:hypothetical protein